MEYRLDLGPWEGVFAVPCSLVDRHLKLAGKEQLQALLWALRHAGESFSPKDLAAALGVSVDAAQDAIDYWIGQGVLSGEGGSLRPQPEAAPAPAAAPEPSPPTPPRRLPKPDALYLAQRRRESQEVRQLLEEAQSLLGILSPAMTSTILAAHDDYGLPAPVLVMLLQYVKKAGKANARYIDSMARDWADSGVLTPDAADRKLQELDARRLAWDRVSAAAGLDRRSPSKREAEAAFRWVAQWRFSDAMLAAAYEECVDHTGKFSVAYLDKIFTRWRREGIATPADLDREDRKKAQAREAKKTYDTDEIEEMSFFDVLEEP